MATYYLNNKMELKKEDKVIFNYDTAELIKFNESGFEILELLLNKDIDIDNLEQNILNFINELEKKEIIFKNIHNN